MIRVKLFDGGQATLAQRLLIGAWLLVLASVLAIWLDTSLSQLGSGLSGALISLGRLVGLLATFFVLTQFMLMGRIWWVERFFGLDHLASYHRINGYLAISGILLHPCLIVTGYAVASHQDVVSEYLQMVQYFDFVWLAQIAQILFVIIVGMSIYLVRRHFTFETWYYVHFMVYAAILLVLWHQFALGGSFTDHPLERWYWIFLYVFVGANVLWWRFSWSTLRLLYHQFRVVKVVAETPTTTSVYIEGKNLSRFHSRPGQFILVRIFSRELWKEEHPFTLSWIPHDNMLRLTVRKVGDYTEALGRLQPGAFVLIGGPFGRFTREVARTNKRLFIAGGVGITPLRSLAEEAANDSVDSVLIYGNKTPDDVVLKEEIDDLATRGLRVEHVFSEGKASKHSITGYVTAELIAQLVPDYQQRDLYLCGPPPMMEKLIAQLQIQGFPPRQLHYERFALHPVS